LASISALAALDGSWVVAAVLSTFTAAVVGKYVLDSASVVSCVVKGFGGLSSVIEKESNLKVVKVGDLEEEIVSPTVGQELEDFKITAK
jgi:hypothetical protein